MDCLILFAKAPVPGRVKTRLMPAYTADQACRIHWALVQQMLQRLLPLADTTRVELHCDDVLHEQVLALKTRYPEMVLKPQVGEGLGERMTEAFTRACIEFDRVVLCGTDSLELEVSHIQQMFLRLDTYDVVFTPVSDGGYIALGARSSNVIASVCDGIDWGTALVMEQTSRLCHRYDFSVALLDSIDDIDTPEDLENLDVESLIKS